MRIDHHAYRQATRVAGFGFLLQAAIAVILLIFGHLGQDTVFRFASFYLFGGLLVWLSLIAVFYQHTQERLEALEEDELAAERAGSGSVFQAAGEEEQVAARRLRLMHQWLMPSVSLLTAAYLAFGPVSMLRHLRNLGDPGSGGAEFFLTQQRGWAVAISLIFAAVAFIFSRFVAGMAKQPAWQNLRGGAGYMVGSAMVLLAIAVALVFRFLGNDNVVVGVAYAIPIYMAVLAGEIVLNFILNMYRPRIPGEVPRPAFDSRVLSLLAAPESIVRSLNEAVNYQFGFDITSSWGYQLLLRSFGWLLGFGTLVLIALNMMVVVEPHQQAVKLSGGQIIGPPGKQVHTSGIMWKLPWPFQSADIYDVGIIREIPLTARRLEDPIVQLWAQDISTDVDLDPFIVGGSAARTAESSSAEPTESDKVESEPVSDLFALVDAEISLQYRIKPDGLLDFIQFSSDVRRRRQRLNMREAALKALAMREITQHLSGLSMEQVTAHGRAEVVSQLHKRIQTVFQTHNTGIEVVAVNVPMLRPSGGVAKNFDDLAIAKQQRRQRVAEAAGRVVQDLAFWVGSPEQAKQILAEIEQWRQLKRDLGEQAKQVIDQRLLIERMYAEAGGRLAQDISTAEAERWIKQMNARAQVKEFEGRLASYRAAPRLFQQREIMNVLSKMLAERRKYLVVGIDPERVNLDVELQEPPGVFGFHPSSSEGESGR